MSADADAISWRDVAILGAVVVLVAVAGVAFSPKRPTPEARCLAAMQNHGLVPKEAVLAFETSTQPAHGLDTASALM